MFTADFHIHSKYSRATSKECVPEQLDLWAQRKGLGLIGTGDFTHAAWRAELEGALQPAEEGLYTLKPSRRIPDQIPGEMPPVRFMVTGEISSIYKADGRVRKVHNLILLPSLADAEALSKRLEGLGANLHSDGRPILGLASRDLLEITLEACPRAVFIPAHIWTPHFSVFGANSGFDRIENCFGDLTPHIHALETGLSSDPPMNWRLSALDRFTLVSNSDAHSPANLAREANLFDCGLSYEAIRQALDKRNPGFCGTLEFFPEEGKYHFDGHRACGERLTPAETRAFGGVCPACGGKITVGVLARVEALADRPEGYAPAPAPRFEHLVPLPEVIAASAGLTPASKKVSQLYFELLRRLGPELTILRETPLADIERLAGPCLAEAVRRVREGKVDCMPGYDGEYGKIKILEKSEIDSLMGQMLFSGLEAALPAARPAPRREAAAQGAPAQESSDRRPEESEPGGYGLNSGQWQAASASSRMVAVLAGPGTGKTRTLVYRIAYLVEKCGVPPEQITAVTFTNKAADEMRSRLEKHFGDKKLVRSMRIGTFHSICLNLLAQPDEGTLIDEFQAQSLLQDVLSALQCQGTPREHLRTISRAKNGAGAPASLQVYEQYNALLAEHNLLDFDDILLRALELFEEAQPASVTSRFTHLLVDEFQDINDLQYRLILKWGSASKGIFVIGDPDQSIYGFRGSDAHCFERLGKDFPDALQVRLSQNYRSTPEIIGCALPVLSLSSGGLQAHRVSGTKVRVVSAYDPYQEAMFVVREIRRHVGGTDMLNAHPGARQKPTASAKSFSELAVLYRTHRQADALEQCLQREGIPYTVAGRDDFLQDRQVRGALSFFRYLLGPGQTYLMGEALQAAGVHSAHRTVIQTRYKAEDNESVAAALRENPVSGHDLACALTFLHLLEKFGPLVQKEKPATLLQCWIEDNSLSGHVPMESLLGTAMLHASMPVFLQNVLLGGETDIVRCGGKKYTHESVTLMTLHGSKGLEYPVVFLLGVSDGLIPLKTGHRVDEAEERRLLYVGMTRAQDELVLLTSGSPSPYLAAIPAELAVREAASVRKPATGKQLNLFDL